TPCTRPRIEPEPSRENAWFGCMSFSFSFHFNRWLTPLLRVGYKRRLEEDDMYSVLPEDRSARFGEELRESWDREVSRAEKVAREPSLTKAIIKCYWKSYLVWGVFTFLEVNKFCWAEEGGQGVCRWGVWLLLS
uniref:Uncharacterized protein n=1 Tax=Sus scrofa TaxID=9823 RepID=A0A8D1J3V6_PIG